MYRVVQYYNWHDATTPLTGQHGKVLATFDWWISAWLWRWWHYYATIDWGVRQTFRWAIEPVPWSEICSDDQN
jgi:hypothetical protein